MFVLPTNKPIEYIPKQFKDIENPPIFLIKPPTKSTVLHIQALLANIALTSEESEERNFTAPLNESMNICLDQCIVGWKNIVDENNNPVEFTKDNFERLNNQDVLMDLYTKVQEYIGGIEKNDNDSGTTST